MRYIIKTHIKQIFKDRKFFYLFFVFIFLIFVLLNAGLVVNNQLSKTENNIKENSIDYKGYIDYKSKGKNNTANPDAISIAKIFGDEVITYDNKYSFATLSYGDSNVFNFEKNKFQNELSENKFNVWDFLVNDYDKDFLAMMANIKLTSYINDYVTKMYQARNNVDDVLSIITKNDTDTYTPDDIVVKFDEENNLVNADDIYDVGLTKVAQVVTKEIDGSEPASYYALAVGDKILDLDQSWVAKDSESNPIYSVKSVSISSKNLFTIPDTNLYGDDLFVDNSNTVGWRNLDLYVAALNQITAKANFHVNYRNELIYSNSQTKQKFAFVDSMKTTSDGFKFNNAANVSVSSKIEHYNIYSPDLVVLSTRYASYNNYKAGDAFKLALNKTGQPLDFTVGGIGFDYNNSFPLIYDTDVVPDAKNEATIFVTDKKFNDALIDTNYVVDSSKLLFQYIGDSKNFSTDRDTLNTILNLDATNVATSKTMNNLDSMTNRLRTGALQYFNSFFSITFLVIAIIFLIVAILSIYILITKDIKKKMTTLGILKANGRTNFEIALEYGIKVTIPSLIAMVLSYPFMILIQFGIFKIVNVFFDFNLSLGFFIGWFFLIGLVATMLLFLFGYFSAYRMIQVGPVDLISQRTVQAKRNRLLTLIDKMKIKKYETKMAFKQFAISWKKTLGLSLTMLTSSIIFSALIDAPYGIKQVKENYYANTDYRLENDYDEVVTNNPMANYSTYSDPLSSSSFYPDAYIVNADSSHQLITFDEMWDATSDGEGGRNTDPITDSFGFNALMLRSKHFSVGAFEKIINEFKDANGEASISAYLKLFLSEVIPSFFGEDQIVDGDWESLFSQLILSKMPAELLAYWNVKENEEKFSVDFQTTKFDEATDELATRFTATAEDKNFSIMGIDSDKFVKADVSQIKNDNEVIASDKLLNTLHKSVGDTIEITKQYQALEYLDLDNNYQEISNDWWWYDTNENGIIDENDTPLYQTDLSHYTNEYYNGDNEDRIGQATPFYLDENHVDGDGDTQGRDGNWYHPYYKMKDVLLKLPSNANINQTLNWNEETNLATDKVVKKTNDGYTINAYSWEYSVNRKLANTFSAVFALLATIGKPPATWMDGAMQSLGQDQQSFIIKATVSKPQTLKIIDHVGIYNNNIAYTSWSNASSMLGVSFDLDHPWFNTKLSNDSLDSDVFFRYGSTFASGNTSLFTIGDRTDQSAKKTMIGKTISVLNTAYWFALKIAIIFLILVALVIIVSISMISNLFISQFYETIMLFKIMGYRNGEINRQILGLFYPVNALTIILGSFIPSIITTIAISQIAHSGTLIPLQFIWLIPVIISIALQVLFLSIYFISYASFIRLNIQEQQVQ